jgi:glutamate-1-semialdehyde 2,1-aminomutase
MITKRPKILVFNWCYHGTVDETFITLHKAHEIHGKFLTLTSQDGTSGPRRGNIGPPVNPNETTKVIEFNDVKALKEALETRDVACVLCEPVMTNIGTHIHSFHHGSSHKITLNCCSFCERDFNL